MVDPNTAPPQIPREPVSLKIAEVLCAAPDRIFDISALTQSVAPEQHHDVYSIVDNATRIQMIRRLKAPIAKAVDRSYLPQYVYNEGLYFQSGVFTNLGGEQQVFRAASVRTAAQPALQEIREGRIQWQEPVAKIGKFLAWPGDKNRRQLAGNIADILRTQRGVGYRYDELADMLYPEDIIQAVSKTEPGAEVFKNIHRRVGNPLGGRYSDVDRELEANDLVVQKGAWVPDASLRQFNLRRRSIVRAMHPSEAVPTTDAYRAHTVYWE